MSRSIIARRYAEALLEALDSAGAESGAVVEELGAWGSWLASDDDAAVALRSPVLALDRRAALLDALGEASQSAPLVRRFLQLLLEKDRIELTGDIVETLQGILDERAGRIRGDAVTAYPIDDEAKQQIQARLSEAVGREPVLRWQEEPSIIGGFRVRIGDRVWDATVRTQLERLGETIRKEVR